LDHVRPVPDELADRIRRQRFLPPPGVPRIPHAIAASVLLFVLGFAGGYLLSDAGVEPQADAAVDIWIMRVAQYQLLYGRETLALKDPSAAMVRDTELRLGSRLGLELRIPGMDQHGLAFKRGQLLSFAGEPLVQLTYLPQQGKPIAYCIIATSRPDSEPEAGNAEGLELVHWRRNGFAHVVIGEADRASLGLIAQTAYSRTL